MVVGLLLILLLVLFLPFFVKFVERNLEVFLFGMGLIAASIGGVLDKELLHLALEDPVGITLAVFIASIIFKWLREWIQKWILKVNQALEVNVFLTLIIVGLGLLSSVLTAIVAAIILVSIIGILQLDRKTEVKTAVLACFAIGIGSVITPIGEPLATITTYKLDRGFSYLFHLVGMEVVVGVLLIGIIALIVLRPNQQHQRVDGENSGESYIEIITRSIKIYLFVMGLTLLGASYETLVNRYLLDLEAGLLYWINMVSAVLDNATLAAAEISPAMGPKTIRFILLSLMISGGMLIPGNIPNIISATKLGITSKEWAKHGLALGFSMLSLTFVYLAIFN